MNSIAILLLTVIAFTSLGRDNVHEVRMIGMRFVPKTITVRRGDKVRFINNSNIIHNVVFDFFESNYLKQDERVDVQFDSKGKFNYFCRPHKSMNMNGSIVVTE